MSEAFASPVLCFGQDDLHIGFSHLFGIGGEGQCRRFLRRVFALPEVRCVEVEPNPGKAVVRFQSDGSDRKAFLRKLAETIGGSGESVADDSLPCGWAPGESLALRRFGEIISMFDIAQTGPGRLLLRHSALNRDPALCRHLEDAVNALEGVTQATTTASMGRLWVRYQPETTDVRRLIRLAEEQLGAPHTALALREVTPPSRLGLANVTLGLAAVGEFAVPVVLPVCVGMLILSNLGTIGDAGKQLKQGKLGLPVLHTALLGCSITTGQIVAHALMEWSFRFWQRRSNEVLAENCHALIEDSLPIPARVHLIRSEQMEARVRSEELRAGDRIRIEAPSAIPVDGRIVAGSAWVEQRVLTGAKIPCRLACADEVWAGSTVLSGNIEVEVTRTGMETRAAHIAHSLIHGARGLTRDPSLRRRAEAMADRVVPPTLALAALGWTVGGLFTAGAVLHQDHVSGPNLAIPMETLRDMGFALRLGVVPRVASAWSRLGESGFVVLDDHPAWSAATLELVELRSRLAESETDNLLRLVAGACLYMGDERAMALADACHARGLVVRQPPLVALEADRIVVKQGGHLLAIRDEPGDDGTQGGVPALGVEADGELIGVLHFRHGRLPRAFPAVQHLRQMGMNVFLLSGNPVSETERLAQRLGVDLHGGDFSFEEKIRFLRGLRRRGVLATYVGNGPIHPQLAGEAHVTVALGGAVALSDEASDMVVLGDGLDAFAQTVGLARSHNERIRTTCRKAWLPNAFCILGGYAGILNGITSGLIANVGVHRVYRQASLSLRETLHSVPSRRLPS